MFRGGLTPSLAEHLFTDVKSRVLDLHFRIQRDDGLMVHTIRERKWQHGEILKQSSISCTRNTRGQRVTTKAQRTRTRQRHSNKNIASDRTSQYLSETETTERMASGGFGGWI